MWECREKGCQTDRSVRLVLSSQRLVDEQCGWMLSHSSAAAAERG